ncbi:putative uncharacterized protein [Lachnospiraceae bacterium CAG:215]|nr:putative uncharacterized protein [Lachnospiraceae bacterium CAG:215]
MENNENMVTSSNAATNGNMAQNDHVEKSKATMPAVNRTFKSTVFIMLFEDKKNLLELYNAISGKHYTDPELLEINTLENAISRENFSEKKEVYLLLLEVAKCFRYIQLLILSAPSLYRRNCIWKTLYRSGTFGNQYTGKCHLHVDQE